MNDAFANRRPRPCALCRRPIGPRGGVMAQGLAPHLGQDGEPCPSRQPGSGAAEPWRGYRPPPAFWPSLN